MVKNTNGGSKAKGFARKHANNNNNNNDVRVVEQEGEIYAVVTKMCGGGMFQCYGIDHVERLCHIRGSFSGRKKRDNIVVNGGWVLIGLREWDRKDEEKLPAGSSFTTTKKAKLPQCDLLEVYNDKDREKLLATVKENWKILMKHDPTRIGFDEDEEVIAFGKTEEDEEFGFKFATAAEIERDELLKLVKSSATEKVKMSDENEDDVSGQGDWLVSIDEL
jgi:translation initiation factor IF-1